MSRGVFFFDECVSIRIAAALRALGVDARHVADTPPFHRGLKDHEWLPQVAELGWFVVTQDTKMRRSAAFADLIQKTSAGVFFFRVDGLPLWRQAAHFVGVWEDVEKIVAGRQHKPPFILATSPRSRAFKLL